MGNVAVQQDSWSFNSLVSSASILKGSHMRHRLGDLHSLANVANAAKQAVVSVEGGYSANLS